MKTSPIKRILIYTSLSFLVLAMVLATHIYLVYRPKLPDANTRILARIDVRQPLTGEDSIHFTQWMYQQKGVDHVLVNPHSQMIVFTFFPFQVSGNKIVGDFKSAFSLKAERFLPTEENLKHSCPVASSSFTYKVYQFINKII